VPGALAAIDVGTNSVHLVVARLGEEDHFDVLTREKEMVRLGTGSGDMRRLEDDAIERGVAALARAKRIADSFDAPVRAVATSAVREAENHMEFLERAEAEAGIEVEIVSGVEEARLIHLGVLQALPIFEQRALVCDIGGGSTELMVGERGSLLTAVSLKLGALRLTNRFFPGAKVHPSAVSSCRRHIAAMVSDFARRAGQLGHEVAVGSSGTIEQLVRLARTGAGEPEPTTWNGARITAPELRAVVKELISARKADNVAALPGMDARRADIILAGALILEGVFDGCSIDELVLSEYALREGVLLDTLERSRGGILHHLQDVSRRGVEHLAASLDEDPSHSAHVAHLALQLFDATAEVHGLGADAREYLEAAALLANVGLSISHSKHHKHTYYVIRNSDRLVGLTDHEIELIAQIARYHRKSGPKATHPEWAALDKRDQELVRTCAAILRVAIGLDRGHESRVRSVGAVVRPDRLVVEAVPAGDGDVELERYAAGERTGLLEEVTGRPVEVRVAAAS
jgi:exopolyphosphatase/guanosine-5'-triphosphate,3'-diphosphate pyrophosphatase